MAIMAVNKKYKDGKLHLCPDLYTDGVWAQVEGEPDKKLTDILNEIDAKATSAMQGFASLVTPGAEADQAAGNADVFKDLATLQAATSFLRGGAEHAPQKNDYAEVVDGDRTLVYGNTASSGAPVWAYRYTIPHSPLTDAQRGAINSTVTATWKASVDAAIAGGTGTGLTVSDAGTLTVDFAAQDDTSSANKAVSPAYVAGVIADLPTGGGSGGVDEAAVRLIVTDALDNYDFSINDALVLNAVNKVLAGTDVGQINQRLDTLEAAFNVGGSSSTPYPGVSAIITMEVADDDFFLVSGIHDATNKRLLI